MIRRLRQAAHRRIAAGMGKSTVDKSSLLKQADMLFNTFQRVFYGRRRIHSLQRESRTESVKRHRRWQNQLDQRKFFDQVFESRS